eukprot:gene141-149_t
MSTEDEITTTATSATGTATATATTSTTTPLSAKSKKAGLGENKIGSDGDVMKNNLREYKNLRDKVLNSVTALLNQLSRRTFFTPDKIDSSLGDAVKPALLAVEIDHQILESFALLEELQGRQEEVIDHLEGLVHSSSINSTDNTDPTTEATASSLPCDAAALGDVIDQMRQQHLLERTIVSQLSAQQLHSEGTIDQEAFLTLAAAFDYSPYLRLSDLDHLLSC